VSLIQEASVLYRDAVPAALHCAIHAAAFGNGLENWITTDHFPLKHVDETLVRVSHETRVAPVIFSRVSSIDPISDSKAEDDGIRLVVAAAAFYGLNDGRLDRRIERCRGRTSRY
jgi:hypothetical protein